MENAKALVSKILSNEISAFFFVAACAVAAFLGVAGGYYTLYKLWIAVGAY